MSIYIFSILSVIVLLGIWAAASYLVIRNIEKPVYTVLEKRSGYEIRRYRPYVVAETDVSGEYENVTRTGFRIIANYIFGDNIGPRKIAINAPVRVGTSEKIAMTAPVINTLSGASNTTKTVSFVLPAQYTIETLPKPNDRRIRLVSMPERTVAALRFTWYVTPKRLQEKTQILQGLLKHDDISVDGEAQVARYNPPLSMPLLLRNEILLPIVR